MFSYRSNPAPAKASASAASPGEAARQLKEALDRIAQLEAALGLTLVAPAYMSLTPMGEKLVGLMRAREVVTYDAVRLSLKTSEGLPVTSSNDSIRVIICLLRKKLKPYGIEIAAIYGRGFRLTGASKLQLSEMCKHLVNAPTASGSRAS